MDRLTGVFVLGVMTWTLIHSSGCSRRIADDSEVIDLHGAGSYFSSSIYEPWFKKMMDENPGLNIRYEKVGSGAGVDQFIDELVDFAASDDPLSDSEIDQVDRGVCQMPMTSGAIVLAYHLPDAQGNPITGLKLSRKAYAGIFLGQIRSWLDDEIVRHNPGVAFPDLPIQVEYRLDASGTTSALSRHLSAISDDWKEGPGIGRSIIWPVGAGMPKDDGVVRGLRQVPGSIGYLSYAIAKQHGLPMAVLENKSGEFIAPDLDSIQLGLSGLSWSISEELAFDADPAGPGSYPIVSYSWVLCYRVYDDPLKLAALKQLFSYGLQDGQKLSRELGYVALSEPVCQNALKVLDSITLPSSADSSTSLSRMNSDSLENTPSLDSQGILREQRQEVMAVGNHQPENAGTSEASTSSQNAEAWPQQEDTFEEPTLEASTVQETVVAEEIGRAEE